MKLKQCSVCLKETVLWLANPKTCKSCMPRIPIKSNRTAQEPKKAKHIAKVSQKQLDRLKAYKKVRDKFLKENLYCEYPNCNSMEVTLHHGNGRIGDLLTDVTHFHSLCPTHHRLIEVSPLLAKQLGLSGNRLDKTHE